MRNKIVFSIEQEQFIKTHYLKMSSDKIGKHLGFNGPVVKRFMNEQNLHVPKEISLKFRRESMIGKTSFTEKEDAFINANYLKMPEKAMAKALGRSGTGVRLRLKMLDLKIPEAIVTQRKKASQFNKGDVPPNKGKKQTEFMCKASIEKTKATRFKKGDLPHNAKYDGYQRITKDGYIEMRVKPRVFKLKHILEWEKLNGKLPNGFCLRCVDGNTQNTTPTNWKLISREENMKLNTIHRYPAPLQKAMLLVSKLNKQL